VASAWREIQKLPSLFVSGQSTVVIQCKNTAYGAAVDQLGAGCVRIRDLNEHITKAFFSGTAEE